MKKLIFILLILLFISLSHSISPKVDYMIDEFCWNFTQMIETCRKVGIISNGEKCEDIIKEIKTLKPNNEHEAFIQSMAINYCRKSCLDPEYYTTNRIYRNCEVDFKKQILYEYYRRYGE